jgi:hypothetical protein
VCIGKQRHQTNIQAESKLQEVLIDEDLSASDRELVNYIDILLWVFELHFETHFHVTWHQVCKHEVDFIRASGSPYGSRTPPKTTARSSTRVAVQYLSQGGGCDSRHMKWTRRTGS